jgi:hypothetical protein
MTAVAGLAVDGDTTDWLQMPRQVGNSRVRQRGKKLIELIDIPRRTAITIAHSNHDGGSPMTR